MNGAKKRKLLAGGASVSAKTSKTSAVPRKSAKSKSIKRSVGIDSLPWSKAKLPDMFNDAEGFYGLEEVEGVEVIRGENNIVEFVCSHHDTFGDFGIY